MSKKLAALLTGLVVSSIPAHASAQVFSKQGDISFAADRLMGVYIVDRDGPNNNSDFLFGLGGPPGWGNFQYQMPRLGIDGFVIDHLSLGGSVTIGHDGNSDNTGFMLEPRVGYAIPIGGHFGFWPRGGITVWNGNRNNDDGVALTFEAPFWGAPSDWGFLFGPTFDFQFDNPHWHDFGLIAAGVFGWL